jgi:hypothetical protein
MSEISKSIERYRNASKYGGPKKQRDYGEKYLFSAPYFFPRRQTEHLLMFSCKTHGFYPSCHLNRFEEWGEWMREKLLLDTPVLRVVFTILKMLLLFFSFKRKRGGLCRCIERALLF